MAKAINLNDVIDAARADLLVVDGVADDLRAAAEATDDPSAWAEWARVVCAMRSTEIATIQLDLMRLSLANADAIERARAGQLIAGGNGTGRGR
jgi:hypothetical protein